MVFISVNGDVVFNRKLLELGVEVRKEFRETLISGKSLKELVLLDFMILKFR